MVRIVNQSFLAHHRVIRKKTPTTIDATLLATMSKPEKMSAAPIRDCGTKRGQLSTKTESERGNLPIRGSQLVE